MGGEPTFVSVDDMDGDEWQIAAMGPNKRRLAGELIARLKQRFAPQGLIHYGQGKWYPGEPLPRWALTCLWRTDGQPLWQKDELLAVPQGDYSFESEAALRFSKVLARRLGVNPDHAVPAYEDALYYLWKERRLPANAELQSQDLSEEHERSRLARVLEERIGHPVGSVLPLTQYIGPSGSGVPETCWVSGEWPVRSEQMFLIPGDSPMGLRLPLDSLPKETTAIGPPCPLRRLRKTGRFQTTSTCWNSWPCSVPSKRGRQTVQQQILQRVGASDSSNKADGPSVSGEATNGKGRGDFSDQSLGPQRNFPAEQFAAGIIRTALCVEVREGRLHVFMPPTERLEGYLELLTAVELTADELKMPVAIEGYLPPHDYRLQHVKATPDPGVIEVNVQPAASWQDLVDITSGIYEDARQSRLGTEKFDLDGTHTGTGGGNHVVLGGPTPSDSPFLRRPDLLRSLLAYWHNHPSLSYLFSGKFIGPTSQAPRVDEGRRDALL